MHLEPLKWHYIGGSLKSCHDNLAKIFEFDQVEIPFPFELHVWHLESECSNHV